MAGFVPKNFNNRIYWLHGREGQYAVGGDRDENEPAKLGCRNLSEKLKLTTEAVSVMVA